MNVDGIPYRTIWPAEDGWAVMIIDQTRLPFEFVTRRLETVADAATPTGRRVQFSGDALGLNVGPAISPGDLSDLPEQCRTGDHDGRCIHPITGEIEDRLRYFASPLFSLVQL